MYNILNIAQILCNIKKKLCNYLLKFAHLARAAAPGPAITAAAAPRAAAEGPVRGPSAAAITRVFKFRCPAV